MCANYAMALVTYLMITKTTSNKVEFASALRHNTWTLCTNSWIKPIKYCTNRRLRQRFLRRRRLRLWATAPRRLGREGDPMSQRVVLMKMRRKPLMTNFKRTKLFLMKGGRKTPILVFWSYWRVCPIGLYRTTSELFSDTPAKKTGSMQLVMLRLEVQNCRCNLLGKRNLLMTTPYNT